MENSKKLSMATYPINKEKHDEVMKQLEEKRKERVHHEN